MKPRTWSQRKPQLQGDDMDSKAPKVPGWGCQRPDPQPSDALPPSDLWQGLAVLGRHQARFIYATATHTHG
jgi:hypothetical protein